MNEFIHLFPSPVYKTSVAGHQEFKQTVVPKLLDAYEKEPTKKERWAIYCNTWQTTEVDAKDFAIISKDINSAIEDYLKFLELSHNNYRCNGWVNVHDSKMYQELHNHVPAIISGIYYIQFDKTQHRSVIFSNPNTNYITLLDSYKLKMKNPNMGPNRNIGIDIDEGEMILFPSTLDHIVPISPNAIDKRISLSFNVYIT
tara:strand:+ start:54 stop:653 length:600 start_codon:yes stop_codon:yes gene_type:complete